MTRTHHRLRKPFAVAKLTKICGKINHLIRVRELTTKLRDPANRFTLTAADRHSIVWSIGYHRRQAARERRRAIISTSYFWYCQDCACRMRRQNAVLATRQDPHGNTPILCLRCAEARGTVCPWPIPSGQTVYDYDYWQ